MTKRKAVSDKLKILSLRYHAQHICPICYGYITVGEEIDWDHRQAISRGGAHDHFNVQMVHRACHRLKTFHPRSKATSIGSDVFEAAKTKRLANPKPSKHPMPKSNRKMQSRPWPKKRPASG